MPKVTPLSQNSHLAIRCTSLLLRTSMPFFIGTADIITEKKMDCKNFFKKFAVFFLFFLGEIVLIFSFCQDEREMAKVLRKRGKSYIIKQTIVFFFEPKIHVVQPAFTG